MAMLGPIVDHQTWKGDATGSQRVEARAAAEYPMEHRTASSTTKNSDLSVNCAEWEALV